MKNKRLFITLLLIGLSTNTTKTNPNRYLDEYFLSGVSASLSILSFMAAGVIGRSKIERAWDFPCEQEVLENTVKLSKNFLNSQGKTFNANITKDNLDAFIQQVKNVNLNKNSITYKNDKELQDYCLHSYNFYINYETEYKEAIGINNRSIEFFLYSSVGLAVLSALSYQFKL